MVNLYGLYVNEALEYAKLEFLSAIFRSDKVVRFIVGTSSLKRLLEYAVLNKFFCDGSFMILGKGLHAKDGKAKNQPALEKLCKEYVGNPRLSHPLLCILIPHLGLSRARPCIPPGPKKLESLLSSVNTNSLERMAC